MNNVIELTHPLIQHKISRLRSKTTGYFRVPRSGGRDCHADGV